MLFSLLSNNDSFETKVIIFFTFAVAVIVALTAHEFSHAFVAHKLGDNTAKAQGRMTFNPLSHFDPMGLVTFLFLGFGWAKPVPINTYNFKRIKRDTFLVSISGATSNFILAFVFYPLYMLLLPLIDNTFFFILYYLCLFLFQANLVFLVFNLLPIYPLDGFNALASQLKYSNPYVIFMQRYGSLVLITVVIIFAYTNIFSHLVNYAGYPIRKFWDLIIF